MTQVPVLAAGALCWRIENGKARILVVHRQRRNDISLPKGKVDPGESLPQTAVREIEEETGVDISLGAPLGTTEYLMQNGRNGGRPKIVHYWAAHVDDEAHANSRFESNDEISDLDWLSLTQAKERLTYPHDLDILNRFEDLRRKGAESTFGLIILRHAKAVPPGDWDGPDATRPLLHRGLEQSVGVAPGVAAFGPRKIISSTATRCVATVEPLAKLTGLEIKETTAISQDAHERGVARVEDVIAKRLEKRKTAVLCSHGPVIPELIGEIAAQTGTRVDSLLRSAAMLSTGQFAVLHLSTTNPSAGIVGVETH